MSESSSAAPLANVGRKRTAIEAEVRPMAVLIQSKNLSSEGWRAHVLADPCSCTNFACGLFQESEQSSNGELTGILVQRFCPLPAYRCPKSDRR